jgi:hypothetical protein
MNQNAVVELCRIVEAREELMLARLSSLDDDQGVREQMAASSERQARLGGLILEGERALEVLIASIGKRKRDK